MSASSTVFIVDSDLASREFVVQIVEEMCIASQQFANAESFVESKSTGLPGCLVTEFRLHGMSGIELQESLSTDCIALPVIFVTAYAETHLTVRAMRNGAVTVLDKPCSEQDLWDAIRKGLTLDRSIRRIDARHDEFGRRLSRLTQKERHVLDLIVMGKTNKAIAAKLDVSIRTVETRRHQIFKKTGTESVAALVRFLLQSGVENDG